MFIDFMGVNDRWSGRQPISDIWKKKKFNSSQWDADVLGALRAFIDEDTIYLDMVSIRPGYKRNSIASKMIEETKNLYPGRKLDHSDSTLVGYQFLKKTGNLAHDRRDGGGTHGSKPTRKKLVRVIREKSERALVSEVRAKRDRKSPLKKSWSTRLAKAQNGLCFYCGEKPRQERGRIATMDHFIPHAKGGGDRMDNLVYACQRCDSKKGDRMPTPEEIRRFEDLKSTTVAEAHGWGNDRPDHIQAEAVWIGVTDFNKVKAELVRRDDNEIKTDPRYMGGEVHSITHDSLKMFGGHGAERWRFMAGDNTVYWWSPMTDIPKLLLHKTEDFLAKKGEVVKRHKPILGRLNNRGDGFKKTHFKKVKTQQKTGATNWRYRHDGD